MNRGHIIGWMRGRGVELEGTLCVLFGRTISVDEIVIDTFAVFGFVPMYFGYGEFWWNG